MVSSADEIRAEAPLYLMAQTFASDELRRPEAPQVQSPEGAARTVGPSRATTDPA